MTSRSRARAIAAVVTLAASILTSGCNDPAPTPSLSTSSTATSSSSTTTTTTSPPTLSPADKDVKAAADTISRYWKVVDELAADPRKSLNLVATVARGQAADQSRIEVGTIQAHGWRQVGESVVASSKAATKDGKTFSVVACVDVSRVNVVDKAGKSVLRPGRPKRQQYTYAVEKASQGFFVTIDTLKGKPC